MKKSVNFQTDGFQKIENFFVKVLPVLNVKKRELITKYGIFKKEALLYSILAPELQKYSGKNSFTELFDHVPI